MASEKQLLFFKSLYDEENARELQLRELAKTYLSLTALFSAFAIFVLKDQKPVGILLALPAALSLVSLVVALALVLMSIGVRDYELPNDPRAILERYDFVLPDDEDFADERIAEYTVACERNVAVNNRKARLLSVASYLFLLGVASMGAHFLIALAGESYDQKRQRGVEEIRPAVAGRAQTQAGTRPTRAHSQD